MTVTPASAGTLDAAVSVVNGSRGFPEDWDQVDWARAEAEVRRLRQRIFTASRAGEHRKVRSLQRLMLRSRANALISTRRVTQINQGRGTAGIDGRTALFGSQRIALARWAQQRGNRPPAAPVRRIYIPKANGNRRPLGIPVISDRAAQAVVLNALEPEWEARFESRSYGFRPGRGCHDAIEAIFAVGKGKSPKRAWVLDADLTAAFDRINHNRLLEHLHGFPARQSVARWLRAGVVENRRYAPTLEGTPQGGVISPLLMNIALHGIETAAGARQYTTPARRGWSVPGTPVVVRYADDLVALCSSQEQAEQVKERLAQWLAPRGLTFNEDKTRIVHLSEGFDFLGFTVRHYRNPGKLLIPPSTAAVKRFRARLRTEVRSLYGANAMAVISRLNPILRGWAAYYRTGVSKEVFGDIDSTLVWTMLKWAKHRHETKSYRWIVNRYFGRFHPTRQDRWLFGDRETGACLTRLSWTPIRRHQMVDADASPDDPALAYYWRQRRRRPLPPDTPTAPGLPPYTLRRPQGLA
ncbi:group II intron reverse transcriptase/maturase [Kineosporia babensis]|uniref:Group II intron reverse transcriptase/maturase n=1 Tax=Kineosporia babensis TaxID=499548 RepID=A0A9X1NLJ9_9ACTN|nr:group II intron reverse transcriptase/maturase [Kineosporia babensis]MCD5317257.1 group II intron reverse transcriptase/maturase [Kineosporia babensis]